MCNEQAQQSPDAMATAEKLCFLMQYCQEIFYCFHQEKLINFDDNTSIVKTNKVV